MTKRNNQTKKVLFFISTFISMNNELLTKIRNFPFNVALLPFFYGWAILFWGSVGVILSVPGQTSGVSVFTEPIIRTLGIDPLTLASAYGIGTMGSSLMLTWAGKMYDKYGSRIVGSVVSLLLGSVLVGLSYIDKVIFFVRDHTNLPVSISTLIIFSIGFFFLRFLGQGVLTMVSRNMIMKWFDQYRGRINAIHGSIVAFAFAYSPKFFHTLILNSSWEEAWRLLGMIIGLGFVVLIWIFYRDNPVQCGLIPDGKELPKKNARIQITTSPIDYQLKDAKKTRLFWAYALTLGFASLLITAITFNIESVFSTGGYNMEQAVLIFFPIAGISVMVNFLGSWLADHIRISLFLFACIIAMVISSLSVVLINHSVSWARWIMIIGNGVTNGTFTILVSITWPRFFGTRYLGEISGMAMSLIVGGSAIGPLMFRLSQKFTGNYDLASIFSIFILAIIFALSLKIRKVNKAEG